MLLNNNNSIKAWFDKDFSSCVVNGDPECRFDPVGEVNQLREMQMTFFCGSAPECSSVANQRRALSVAADNLERRYAVVGLAEDMAGTMAGLERLLPQVSASAGHYWRRLHLHSNTGSTAKANVSKEAASVLRRNLSSEMEFYDLAVQRFRMQQRSLHLLSWPKCEESIICNLMKEMFT